MSSHNSPTVDDICKDFGVTKDELVAILSQDETLMTSFSRECKPLFLRNLDEEASRLTGLESPFSTASAASNSSQSFFSSHSLASSPPKAAQSRSPVRPEELSPTPHDLHNEEHHQSNTVNDGPEVVKTLIETLREQVPVLHSVTRAVTRYEANGRVGPMLGGVGALLATREPESNALGKMIGLFALSNAVPKEYVSLLSHFGYSSSGSSTQRQLRQHLIEQQEGSFSRPELRRLERYLVNYECDRSESQTQVSMRTSTTPGKRRRVNSNSGIDSTTTTTSSEDLSKSLAYPQETPFDIPDAMQTLPTNLPPPPTSRPWYPQPDSHSAGFAVYRPPQLEDDYRQSQSYTRVLPKENTMTAVRILDINPRFPLVFALPDKLAKAEWTSR
ncbi:hypothetical protein BJ742DRAFT_868040 [Cladochytrium replicatum]|nr:hypothetical protein BJ742DRAFT_868040 [Cladochytrium replicatum]